MRTALAEEVTAETGLAADGIRVVFGGLVAVDDVSIRAPRGRITGLIGPNGAGKTTTFNACTGLLRPAAGTVRLDGHDVSGVSPSRRARAGLGRTFQRMELCDELTVRENVALGVEASIAGANLLRQLFATKSERAHVAGSVEQALDRCGLQEVASTPAGQLSTGQRRLVELARALAGPYHTLLLDEPSSGLDVTETGQFGEILSAAVADGERGILLVEHDMELVMDICDYLYVVDFGKPIFEGTADEVRASEVVRAAYLGEPA